MRLSLRTRLSIFLTLIIALLSGLSTWLFISSNLRQVEEEITARGTALTFSLSKLSELGLASEDLNIMDRAAYIVRAEHVKLVQVYSNIWDPLDALPFDLLREPPDKEAVEHYGGSLETFYVSHGDRYDFYGPILFRPYENSEPIHLGFVRLALSVEEEKSEIRRTVMQSIALGAVFTLVAVLSINILLGRLIIRPLLALHSAASRFREGELPEGPVKCPTAEINELADEFHVMCVDIKEKELSLIKSEARMKSFFERVEQAIFRLDLEGNVVETNSHFRESFGPVQTLCEILSPAEKDFKCLKEAQRGNIVQRETKVTGGRGEDMTVLLSLYRENDLGGELVGYDGYMIDVTEKKRLEEGLIRAQKLEAVGTLAGGIAHDFNNLLAAILGYAEIITDAVPASDPVHKYASIIRKAASRGAELTDRILTSTRREKFQMRPVRVNDIVKGTVELLSRSIPKNIDIELHLAEGLPEISADASQLQQALMNLALNSRDAMASGGRLVIESRQVSIEESAPTKGRTPAGGHIKLSVTDTGLGMSKDIQGRIFDPFFTTKDPGKGTGLGLYMVYSIIANHGGFINVYSEPGKGTRFTVYLPVGKADAVRTYEDSGEELRGSGTILVIDDEPDVREMFMDMLTPLGYEVILSEGGREVLKLYRDYLDKVSLVVLDMVMPNMDGSAVFHALREINPDVRVLLCSGFSQNGFASIDLLMKGGAKGFIQKPFTRRSIALAIKRAMAV